MARRILQDAAHALGENGHRALDPNADEPLRWTEYRARLYAHLKDAQSANGSWGDQSIGPEYATSLALIILQLDNDFLPAFSR